MPTVAPLTIGSLSVWPPFVLAPICGVTSWPFRLLCREQGAGAVVSEMVSAVGLVRSTKESIRQLHLIEEERPVGIQLEGSDPDLMVQALDKALAKEPDFIDLNAGCPVKKVVKGGKGSALLKNLDLFKELLHVMRARCPIPLTVKMRLGWTPEELVYLEAGRIAEGEGVDAITLHARTRSQMYSGHADWSHIERLVEAVRVPVIGNGDVTTAEEGMARLTETGVQGVMIGRGAWGNPWIFRDLLAMSEGREPPPLTTDEFAKTILRHFDYYCTYVPEAVALVQMRKHLLKYFKGKPNAAKLRTTIPSLDTREAVEASIRMFAALDTSRSEK